MHDFGITFPHSAQFNSSCKTLNYSTRKWFTPDEDKIILEGISPSKKKNWKEIAQKIPGRTARQCRDRYNNSLKNKIEKKPWTIEEAETIIKKFFEVGPKWVTISAFLDGRSGNNVKNRWHKYINKNQKYKLPERLQKGNKIMTPIAFKPATAYNNNTINITQGNKKKNAERVTMNRNEGKEKECLQTCDFFGADDSFKQPVNLGNDDNPDNLNDDDDMFYGYMPNDNPFDYFCLGKGMMDPF